MAITLKTAEEEYRKNPDIKREDIAHLKEWIENQPHLPNLDEVTLIVFYHSCRNDMEFTKSVIDLNLSLRTQFGYVFKDRDPTQKKNLAFHNIALFAPLPEQTPEGFQVFYCALLDYSPSNFNLEQSVKNFVLMCDLFQYENGTLPGIIIIINLHKVVFGHITKLSISTVRDVLFYLQEAMPVRLKGVHFMNAPVFMDKILALLKPFMKKQLTEILYVHSNLTTMDPFVPRNCLPTEAGGGTYTLEKLRAINLDRLTVNRQLLIDEETKNRVKESLRPAKSKSGSRIAESFRKLDID